MSANSDISHEDVRLVAAIARATTMRRAQAASGGHLATLYRRLRDLEARMGGPLFERRGERLVPTPRAEPFLDVADAIDDRLAEVERRVAALDDRLVGPLTVTTADTLVGPVCACLKAFGAQHPQVRIALDVGAPMLDLARREADVAIRPTTSPPETLIGRRAGAFDYAAYRAKGGASDRWIAYHGDVASTPAARWLADHAGEDEAALRVNSLSAAVAGLHGGRPAGARRRAHRRASLGGLGAVPPGPARESARENFCGICRQLVQEGARVERATAAPGSCPWLPAA